MAEPTEALKPLPFSRVPSFFELYANNVNFESNVWDLNVIFSLLDQVPTAPPFKQIGSVHIPWTQAKIMAYYLSLNIAFHEMEHGAIKVPAKVAPPSIDGLLQDLPDDPKAKALVERMNAIRAELGL
jgi:hypothetical protein